MAPDSQRQARIAVDWSDWHASYDRPASPLAQRLEIVEEHVARALGQRPSGPISLISICAGQAHDLIGALRGHPRRGDVRARLVELDEGNVRAARSSLRREGLDAIEMVQGDASLVNAYDGATPADVVLLCGVLGNISVADVRKTISLLPSLCSADAHVVWTRNRNPPDLVPEVLEMFASAGFRTSSLRDGPNLAVATSQLTAPSALVPEAGTRLFTFVGQDALWPHLPERARQAMRAIFDTRSTLEAIVEAVRAIPLGGPGEQDVERMLREARGTPVSKHLFLADMLARGFPHTAPRMMLRIYELDERRALALYGKEAAAALGGSSVRELHGYVTAEIEGRRIALDVSLPGEPWDGRQALALVCGPGDDRTVGENPRAQAMALLQELRAEKNRDRDRFDAVLTNLNLDQRCR